jgi:hypothetical protein
MEVAPNLQSNDHVRTYPKGDLMAEDNRSARLPERCKEHISPP